MTGDSRGPWAGRLTAGTILLGAFLLFQVQPLLSKWILPWFGGGPAVWSTCLLFFQTGLLAGYLYAHLSERVLPPGARRGIHAALVLSAALFLPVAPAAHWKPPDGERPAGRILLLLGANVGLPYLLLSSTGPLLQSWFARAYPGRSPYRLYALSNLGSLAALLTYPFLLEPLLGLRRQSALWSGAFLVYLGLFAAGLFLDRPSPVPSPPEAPPEGAPAPTRFQRALWVALPAFASWMLTASTQELSQDLAVLPFLWVMPLGVYLLSFILAFDHPRWYVPRITAPLAAAAVFLAAVATALHATHSAFLAGGIGLVLLSLFLLSLLSHGELARLKPAPRYLTGYYLAIALGGALGGVFVNLLAPLLFSTLVEWKLGMGIAYLGAWGVLLRLHRDRIRAHLNQAALLFVVAGLGLALVAALLASYVTRLESARNFYGVVAVEEALGRRDLVNGAILHGRQMLREDLRRRPTTYFVEGSGIGRALGLFRGRGDLRVGVVGLGAGTIAAYGELPTQGFRFYEINPEVTRLARTYFTFLRDCPARLEIVPGDARLSLEREPSGRFHVLALDAFSGEAIPTHLLTREAMELYARHLDPEGVIAVHISNRFLDLAPVVRGGARALGLETARIDYEPKEDDLGQKSSWLLCTRSPRARGELFPKGAPLPHLREILWTDDRSDLLSVIRLH